METPFLVRCIREKLITKDDANLTENSIYLVIECIMDYYIINKNDAGISRTYLSKRFVKLNFTDIWELKRNGKLLPS